MSKNNNPFLWPETFATEEPAQKQNKIIYPPCYFRYWRLFSDFYYFQIHTMFGCSVAKPREVDTRAET